MDVINVVQMPNRLDRLAERAINAAYAWEAGTAKQGEGRKAAIVAVIEYGNALRESRARYESDKEFGQWIVANGLDRVKPFDVQQERYAAMKIAEISTHKNFPVGSCPRSRPQDILAWWRSQQPENLGKKPRINKTEAVAQTLKAETGQWPDVETLGREAGVHPRSASNALRAARAADEATAKAKIELETESVQFTKAQEKHIAAKVRLFRIELEKQFHELTTKLTAEISAKVNAQLAERVARAFPIYEQELEEARREKKLFQRLNAERKFPLSPEQYMLLVKVAHSDNSASAETRTKAMQLLNEKRFSLTGTD